VVGYAQAGFVVSVIHVVQIGLYVVAAAGIPSSSLDIEFGGGHGLCSIPRVFGPLDRAARPGLGISGTRDTILSLTYIHI